ncbi:hypothetical protein FGU71_05770 [Erythrobacter insulae]|uniref:Lipopolysaccharide biosynthesis protein n=1 Tax=Erythrobacter insulae TaxID=2584124 RepID=A0A547PB93_9SPHN|nr:oligosaccharide flippase family protein [Erythrobacter insulae]TRD11410.1 hypothetical protein FGU71_05770 [Erythrobacter insulae]
MTCDDESAGNAHPAAKGYAKTAAIGMVWVSAAIAVAKLLSFISQIILGYILSVETYAVFGLAAATLALVAGFQNSSVAKVLIQKGENFDELFPEYSALAFQFGILGAVILTALGFGLQFYYEMPALFPVLAITALSVPILAANTILIADLSHSLQFRRINQAEIFRSLIYAIILVSAAWWGAGFLTVAIATSFAAIIAHLYLRSLVRQSPTYFRVSMRAIWNLLNANRPAIAAGFLIALAMRADYLVLGRILEPELLGFYTFGFMLVASLMQPISTGINQVMMPIFAKQQKNSSELASSLDRYTLVTSLLASVFCLALMGLAPSLIHLAWGGKWDGSQIVILALLFAMPFRFVATIAGVAFEATGTWGLRNRLLGLQAILLATFAGVGAVYGGLQGAILGVIIQRILSGVVDFAAAKQFLQQTPLSTASFLIRCFAPFLFGSAALAAQIGVVNKSTSAEILLISLYTAAAVALTTVLMFVFNPSLRRDVIALAGFAAQKLRRES